VKTIRLSIESLILVAVCTADMLVTLFFVSRGMAVEQNPLMAVFMNYSPWAFVLAKLLSFLPFVIAIEMYRRHDRDFARRVCRIAIGAYVVLFVVLTVGTNLG
jgi:hypothetical protein